MLVSFNEHGDDMSQRAALLFTGPQVNGCLVCPTRTLGCARSLLVHSAV